MGLFLALSGVVGGTSAEVVAALTDLSRKHSGHLRSAPATENEATRLVLAPGPAGVAVLYPSQFMDWDAASAFLSVTLGKPVFSFHIHDGDLWMFQLYVSGVLVTAFNPIPDYWGEDGDEESMRGDAAMVAKHVPGVTVAGIERYLVRWDLDAGSPGKAYPDDEFSIGEDWQLCDFLRKLGFVYPVDNRGEPLGECFSFRAKMT
jgi:hypothetical protein